MFNDLATYAIQGFSVGLVAVCSYHVYLSTSFSGEAPVKFSWLPLLGDALNMGDKPLDFLMGCAKQYGEIFGLVVGGNRLFLITDPHSNDIIIKADPKELSTHEFHNTVLRNFFGLSETTLSTHVGGMDDNLMRSWYSKYLYSTKELGVLTDRMQSYIHAKLKKEVDSRGKQTVDMYAWLSAFIFEASLATLLTSECATFSPDLLESFFEFDKALPIALAGCPVTYLSGALRGRGALYDVASAAKKNQSQLCTLMRKRFEIFSEFSGKGQMAPGDDYALQLAIMWASVGNTIPTTFWVMYFLLQEVRGAGAGVSDVWTTVMAEITRGSNSDGTFAQSELDNMPMLDACITETLRLCSGSMIMREVIASNVTLTLSSGKSYSFRKGDRVGICPPLAHLDEEVFTSSQTFNPRRWIVTDPGATDAERALSVTGKLPENTLRKNGKPIPSTQAFLPFGGGASLCPGRRFARNEIKALVAVLFSSYDLEVEGSAYASRPAFDGSRAGLGIFPPASSPRLHVSPKQ